MDLETTTPKRCTQFVDGFQIPLSFSPEIFRSAVNYKPQKDDIFIVTYPKCGTTWAQNIMVLIFSQGVPMTSAIKFWSVTPFLEITGAEAAEKMSRPGTIKVHLPYHLTPRSDMAKYIYVTRNPKDCCVSYFHHVKSFKENTFTGTFDEFFEYFISGNIEYGDYFDHLMGWYAHRNDPNVLFMTFEEMKERPEETVLKMASFVDDKLYAEPLRNDPSKLQDILKYSSFDYMKETFNKAIDEMAAMSKEDIEKSELPEKIKENFLRKLTSESGPAKDKPKKSEFVRKGVIGDWKSYFNEEQNERLKEKFDERTKGTDIPKLFEKYM